MASIEEHFQSLLSGALEAAFEGRSEEELQGFLESDGLGRFLDKTIPEVSLSLANSLVESTPEMIAGRRAEEASTADARGLEVSGGHAIHYDDDGVVIGLTLLNVCHTLEQGTPLTPALPAAHLTADALKPLLA